VSRPIYSCARVNERRGAWKRAGLRPEAGARSDSTTVDDERPAGALVSVSDDEPTLPGPENEQVDEGKLCENQLAPSCGQASLYSNSNDTYRIVARVRVCFILASRMLNAVLRVLVDLSL